MTHGADGRRRANGLDLAEGLRKGSEVAYGAVLTPVEGTILTVIRDAAEAAEAAAGRQPHVEAVLADVIAAAASSVQRTPTLLPVLEDAGVVDSGGQGLYRILEGALQVKPVDWSAASPAGAATAPMRPPAGIPVDRATAAPGHRSHAGHDGEAHGYETEYMLASAGRRASTSRSCAGPSPRRAIRWSWPATRGWRGSTSTASDPTRPSRPACASGASRRWPSATSTTRSPTSTPGRRATPEATARPGTRCAAGRARASPASHRPWRGTGAAHRRHRGRQRRRAGADPRVARCPRRAAVARVAAVGRRDRGGHPGHRLGPGRRAAQRPRCPAGRPPRGRADAAGHGRDHRHAQRRGGHRRGRGLRLGCVAGRRTWPA